MRVELWPQSGCKWVFANKDMIRTQDSSPHLSQGECWNTGPALTISVEHPGAALPQVCVQMERAWEPAE